MQAQGDGKGRYAFPLFLLIIALLAFSRPSLAAENGEIGLLFQVVTGVALSASIEDICCGELFDTTADQTTSARTGLGESATWVRLSTPLPNGLIQVRPVVDRATLYLPTATGGWQTVESGDMVANGDKLLPSPFMALPLPDQINEGAVYIRIEQFVPVSLAVSHWSLPAFLAMQAQDQTFKLFLLGILAAMIFYNLFVSVVVRDPAFALNALTISALLVIALYLSGYGAAYVWSSATSWSNTVLLAALVVAIGAGGVFIWMFLRAAGDPLARGWPLLITPAIACVLPFTVVVFPGWLITVLALMTSALLFVIALIVSTTRALAGEPKARILLIPLVLAMIPGTAMVALDKYLGVRLLQLGNNGMEVTLCLEAVLFSLALASRIRLTEVEARQASERIVALQNEAASKNIAAQDNERRRLAKELHDGVGQDFLVVLGGLKQLSSLPAAAMIASRMDVLISAASNALGNLRRISREMHPASLEHLGLARALTELIRQTEVADTIAFALELDIKDELLDPDTRLHIYRIVQECLSNILRHAQADRCWVQLSSTPDSIVLIIEDDGVGFGRQNDVVTGTGLGLTSIDERVKACGGHWRKGVSAHGGARLEVTVPMNHAHEVA